MRARRCASARAGLDAPRAVRRVTSVRARRCASARAGTLNAWHAPSGGSNIVRLRGAEPDRSRVAMLARDRPPLSERSKATLPTNSGARAAQHASRRARGRHQQPHSRELNELEDFGRPDHDLPSRRRPTRTDGTGACFPSASARAAQRYRPSVRKRESPTARRRRRASLSTRVQSRHVQRQIRTRGRRVATCRALWRSADRRSARSTDRA